MIFIITNNHKNYFKKALIIVNTCVRYVVLVDELIQIESLIDSRILLNS